MLKSCLNVKIDFNPETVKKSIYDFDGKTESYTYIILKLFSQFVFNPINGDIAKRTKHREVKKNGRTIYKSHTLWIPKYNYFPPKSDSSITFSVTSDICSNCQCFMANANFPNHFPKYELTLVPYTIKTEIH